MNFFEKQYVLQLPFFHFFFLVQRFSRIPESVILYQVPSILARQINRTEYLTTTCNINPTYMEKKVTMNGKFIEVGKLCINIHVGKFISSLSSKNFFHEFFL